MMRFQNHGIGLKIWDVLENDISSNLSLFSAKSVMSCDHYEARSGRIDYFPGNPNSEMPIETILNFDTIEFAISENPWNHPVT